MSTTTEASGSADESAEYPFLDEFRVDLDLQGQSGGTIRSYRSNLRTFLGWLDGDPRELTQQDLKDFLYHLKNERSGKDGAPGVSDSTIANYFSCINSYFRYLKFEGHIGTNIVPEFRERYVPSSSESTGEERQLISVEEMSTLVHATLNVRDRAILVTLAKTGIRRGELVSLDLSDIDWEEQSITLEETAKRSNCLVFFDGECARVLERWLSTRQKRDPDTDALFINQHGNRLQRNSIYRAVTNHAEEVGLHDPEADDLQKKFTPHCCRHWFTTHLRRSGMDREFIQELRGDTRGEAIDIYDHIDREELREAYLAHIPSLGI